MSRGSDLPSPSLPSPDPPPSNSSGYHSMDNDDFDENMELATECSTPEDSDINALISVYNLESPEEAINDDFINSIIGEDEESVSLDDINVDGKIFTV